MSCKRCTWIWDIIVYNEYAVVICVYLIFRLWSSGLWDGEILLKVPLYATLKTSNRLLQNNGTYLPDCMMSWPRQLWSKFSCCENLRSDDVCNNVRVAEKLLTFFVNCRMTPVMTAYPYSDGCVTISSQRYVTVDGV